MKQCVYLRMPQFLFLILMLCSEFSYFQIEAQRTRDDLPYHVQPTRYILRIKPMPEDDMYVGYVKISVLCLTNTSSIVLHAGSELRIPVLGITVREPKISRNDVPALKPLLNLRRHAQTNQLTITLETPLEEWATYEVKIHFSGNLTKPDDWGLFQGKHIDRRSGKKKWYVGTKLKPGMARKMFPCFDGTEYKTTFSISIAKANTSQATVLSNMKRKSVTGMKGADGWLWEHFHPTPRMLPSSIGFTMFELDEVVSGNAPGVDISIYGDKDMFMELEKMLKDFMKLFAFLNSYLERTLPLEKIDIIVFPNFVVDTDTNSWGLISMSDYFIPSDWTALHGLLDQWFHHFVTPFNHDSALCKALHKFLFWESGLTAWNPTDHLDGLLGEDSSPKMNTEHYEWLLRMLNYSLSAETFRLGLVNFMSDRQAFTTYTDNVLWHFLTRSGHQENTLDSAIKVRDIAYSWVGLDLYVGDGDEIKDDSEFSWSTADHDHILTQHNSRLDRMPIVTVRRNYNDSTASVEQHVFLKKRMKNEEHPASYWWIPIIYLTPDNLDPSILQLNTWMKGINTVNIIDLPSKDDFIIMNPEYAGMFVVNYDRWNWELLMNYLKSNKYNKIPELTRGKLLYDAWNMAYFGELGIETALEMSLYLSKETSQVVWEPYLNLINEFLEYISDTTAEPLLEKYILKQLLAAQSSGADWITYKMLCRYGYEQCISDSREAYKFWMKQNDLEYKLTYDQFCYTFKYGSMDEFEYGLEFLIKHNVKDKWNYSNLFFILQTLAVCPVDTEKVNRYLDAIFMEKNGNFSNVDIMTIFIRFRNHAQGRWMALLDFVSHNFGSVKDRIGKIPQIWNLVISEVTRHFITQEGLNEVVAFHKNHKGKFGSAELFIQSSKSKVASEVEWSSINLKRMEKWLHQQIVK